MKTSYQIYCLSLCFDLRTSVSRGHLNVERSVHAYTDCWVGELCVRSGTQNLIQINYKPFDNGAPYILVERSSGPGWDCIEFMYTGKRWWGGCWFIIDFIVIRKWSVWRNGYRRNDTFSPTRPPPSIFLYRVTADARRLPHWNLINFNYVLSKNFPVVEWKCTLKFEWQTLSKRLMTNDLRETWPNDDDWYWLSDCVYVLVFRRITE